MTTRITVDPVTRIEGHLRIDVEVNDEGRVSKSWSSGQMWRGIEKILVGRDPREPGYLPSVFAVYVQPFTPLHRCVR